jgi:hypothetical protein
MTCASSNNFSVENGKLKVENGLAQEGSRQFSVGSRLWLAQEGSRQFSVAVGSGWRRRAVGSHEILSYDFPFLS